MELNKTTIESVLCRLEAKECEAACEKFVDFHEALMDGMRAQLDMTNGQFVRKKRPTLSLREFGLILTRIGLSAVAASEDEEGEDEDA